MKRIQRLMGEIALNRPVRRQSRGTIQPKCIGLRGLAFADQFCAARPFFP
jgi:hypothetical protein